MSNSLVGCSEFGVHFSWMSPGWYSSEIRHTLFKLMLMWLKLTATMHSISFSFLFFLGGGGGGGGRVNRGFAASLIKWDLPNTPPPPPHTTHTHTHTSVHAISLQQQGRVHPLFMWAIVKGWFCISLPSFIDFIQAHHQRDCFLPAYTAVLFRWRNKSKRQLRPK